MNVCQCQLRILTWFIYRMMFLIKFIGKYHIYEIKIDLKPYCRVISNKMSFCDYKIIASKDAQRGCNLTFFIIFILHDYLEL